ncbi:bacteriocin [Lactococcus lactis]|uniref:bacteriocin n=1 Tax=Lactococcus lactis TaxID=1358 RepID=UPI00223BC9B5|nr:bacteriocin [Lactococcus lactis]MCT1170445.1 bacteriocin [Lactococcus lactis]
MNYRNEALHEKNDVIKLSDGQIATIVTGDESTTLQNCYIVRLENEDIRVVDRKTLTLADSLK